MSETTTKSRLVTPDGILSYPKLFAAVLSRKPLPNSKPARSTSILFTVDKLKDPRMIAILQEVITIAKAEWGSAVQDTIDANVKAFKNLIDGNRDLGVEAMCKAAKIKFPFRFDGKDNGYPPEYVMHFQAAAVQNPNYPAPEIVMSNGKPITDAREIYPGVKARISLDVYARKIDENKGISFGLGNIMKLGDGEKLAGGGGTNATEDFGIDESTPEAGKSELEGLLG